eukprot:gene10313-21516_t
MSQFEESAFPEDFKTIELFLPLILVAFLKLNVPMNAGIMRCLLIGFSIGVASSFPRQKLFNAVSISLRLTSSLKSDLNSTTSSKSTPLFPVVSEELVYNGWRKVTKRDVIMPNGIRTSYDIFSQGAPSIVVFVWDRKTRSTTLVREYYPGVKDILYGSVGGVFEEKKHRTPLECAMFELEEEAQLRSDTWIPLLEGDSNGIPFDKYSDNILHPFLVLDCEIVTNPRPMDLEEWIVVERNVPYSKLMELLLSGKMTLPTTFAALLSLRRLEEMGIPLKRSGKSLSTTALSAGIYDTHTISLLYIKIFDLCRPQCILLKLTLVIPTYSVVKKHHMDAFSQFFVSRLYSSGGASSVPCVYMYQDFTSVVEKSGVSIRLMPSLSHQYESVLFMHHRHLSFFIMIA